MLALTLIVIHCRMAKSFQALSVSFITRAKGDNRIRESVCVCVFMKDRQEKEQMRERERETEFIEVQAPVSVNISNYLTVTSGG